MDQKNAPATIGNESARTSASYSTKSAIGRIREALEHGERLTSLDALFRFGSSRLAAVVETLRRRDGLPIQSAIIEVQASSGQRKYVAVYWIDQPDSSKEF